MDRYRYQLIFKAGIISEVRGWYRDSPTPHITSWFFTRVVVPGVVLRSPLLSGSSSLLDLLLSFLVGLGLPPLLGSVLLLPSHVGFFLGHLPDAGSTATLAKGTRVTDLRRAVPGAAPTFARCSLTRFSRVSVFCTARSQSSRDPVGGRMHYIVTLESKKSSSNLN